MPKISDERRAERRAAILAAARASFEINGLHAATMDDIIRRSGLSAGAVYSYFPTKDELIEAALASSMADLAQMLARIFDRAPPMTPAELIGRATAAIQEFSKQDGGDRTRIAMHGWSEALRNAKLRTTMAAIYRAFRESLLTVAQRWRVTGMIPLDAEPAEAASVLFSLILGFVAQEAILGDVDPERHWRGLAAIAGESQQARTAVSTN
jgi:TetR/AcrR family transcriptional regulator, transcriptional repressor of aconitase